MNDDVICLHCSASVGEFRLVCPACGCWLKWRAIIKIYVVAAASVSFVTIMLFVTLGPSLSPIFVTIHASTLCPLVAPDWVSSEVNWSGTTVYDDSGNSGYGEAMELHCISPNGSRHTAPIGLLLLFMFGLAILVHIPPFFGIGGLLIGWAKLKERKQRKLRETLEKL